jgi:glycerol kinase
MLAWQREGVPTYALDGGVFTAGTSLNWLRDELQLFDDPQSIDRLCGRENDSGGVVWIPAQVGLGAPYWNRTVRGAWLGVSLSTTKANMIRAVLEGICVRVAQIVRAMRADSGLSINVLRVDGGLTGSETMMQIQADLLGMPVEVVEDRESTAAGMCRLAARAAGLWTSDDRLRQQVRIARSFEPEKPEDWRQTLLDRFERAVSHLEAWHHDR